MRLWRNFLSLFIGNALCRFLGFVTILYLARTLAISDFGKINFALAIFTYAQLLADPGLSTLGTREVAKNRTKGKTFSENLFVSRLLGLRLLLAFFSFLIMALFVLLISQSPSTKGLIISYGLSLFPFALLLDWFFQAQERMEYIALSRILTSLIYFFLVITLIKSSAQVSRIPFFWLIGNVGAALFLFSFFLRNSGRLKLTLDFSFWKMFLKLSLSLGVAAGMIQVYSNFALVALGFLKGDECVAFYSAAYKLVFFVLMLDRIFCEVVFPLISRYSQISLQRLKEILTEFLKLVNITAIPISVGGTILARPLMHLIYGGKYDHGAVVLQILIWLVFITSLNSIYTYGLIGLDKEKEYAWAITLGTVSNVVLNLSLIPFLETSGAALAAVLSEGLMLMLMYIKLEKVVKLQFWNYLLKPFLSSLIMVFFLWFLREENLFLLLGGGVLIYFASLYLMGEKTSWLPKK
ncbi:MAG: flippase [Candidatus Edwardsbacteria bacterium]